MYLNAFGLEMGMEGALKTREQISDGQQIMSLSRFADE